MAQKDEVSDQQCSGSDPILAIDGCTALIHSAGSTDKELASFFNRRGMAQRALDNNEKAIEDFNEAIKRQPDAAEYYVNRGRVYDVLTKYDQAFRGF